MTPTPCCVASITSHSRSCPTSWRSARVPDRRVRVTAEALVDLDAQLPEGLLDAFVHQDLYPALDLVAADWERLPVRALGHDRYRVLIARGRTVYAMRLDAELDLDGGVSVTSIVIDLDGPQDLPADHD